MSSSDLREQRVLFVGSKRLGLECLKTLQQVIPRSIIGALTVDDATDSRTVLKELRDFCSESKIALEVAATRKDSEIFIQNHRPDIVFVCGWYWLLSGQTLALVRRHTIGVHNSLLPRYRGGSPLVWAIINGEKETGFSMFSLNDSMDEGEIWAQEVLTIGEDETIGEILKRIEAKVVEVLRDIFPKIVSGSIQPRPQNDSAVSYCAPRLPEDGEIDWSQSAQRVHDFIRAQTHPYPGAFSWHGPQRIVIWQAKLIAGTYAGTPGQAALIKKEGVVIVCGDNRAVLLERVGLGDNELTASAVLKSVKTRFPRHPLPCPPNERAIA